MKNDNRRRLVLIKEFIGQGESLEEATQKAIEGLDAKADEEVQIEVLS